MFVVGLAVLGFYKLPWSLTDFDNDIVVKGNLYTPSEKIKKIVCSSYMYSPVYRLSPCAIEEKIESLAPVKHAFVRRSAFPHPMLVIDVLEEFPWACLSSSPEAEPHAVIAESGRLIPISQFPIYPRPILTVCGSKALTLKAEDVKQWGTWINFIEQQTSEMVANLDIRRPYDVRVKTTNIQFRLGIPDTNLSHRLGRLASIIPEVKKYSDQLEYVDLALDNNIPLKLSKEKSIKASKKGTVAL